MIKIKDNSTRKIYELTHLTSVNDENLVIHTSNYDEELMESISKSAKKSANRMRKAFETPSICILCEKYSQNIANIFKENNLKTLPLNKELSKTIFSKTKYETPTKLYWTIEKLMKP